MFYNQTADQTSSIQQPMFYNTAYPINLSYAQQNHGVFYKDADYSFNDIQKHQVFENHNKNYNMNNINQQMIKDHNSDFNYNHDNNLFAQRNINPLQQVQPPIPTPRNNKQQQKNINGVS